jgi:hypothetical protein
MFEKRTVEKNSRYKITHFVWMEKTQLAPTRSVTACNNERASNVLLCVHSQYIDTKNKQT